MKDAEQLGLSQIGQIAVNVHDVQKATAFYRDTLGMKFLFVDNNLLALMSEVPRR